MNLIRLFTISLCLSILSLSAQGAEMFDKSQLEGPKGPHLVIKNTANVRSTPANTGKKLTDLEKKDMVNVLGRAKGTQWLAVRKDGKDIGYVYAPSLTPMIDASLDEALQGSVTLKDQDKPDCTYQITYEGRAVEDDIVFISSDYLGYFKCQLGFDIFKFNAMMFMSEVPVDLGNQPIYQITLNLPDIATGYEEFLSATALFDKENQKVIMDAVSLKAFKEKEFQSFLPAKSPKEAIGAALQLQLASFNAKAWQIIAGKIPNPGDKKPE